MRLLSVQYHHIGPFGEQPLSLIFREGSFLIKAAIGRGKSFLFFDGIVAGLYKYSKRNVISIGHKHASIDILFESNGEYRHIARQLKKTTKGGESYQSSLFRLHSAPVFDQREQTLVYDRVVDHVVNTCHEERIDAKNDKDVQELINALIPEKNLWMHTTMIMQDAENIFSLPKGQRLDVFKQMFDLMSVDAAKDLLHDRKKELDGIIKAYQNTETQTAKFRTSLTMLLSLTKQLTLDRGQREQFVAAIDQYVPLVETITLADCHRDRDEFPLVGAKDHIDAIRLERTTYHTKKESLEKSIEELTKQREHAARLLHDQEQQYATLQQSLADDSGLDDRYVAQEGLLTQLQAQRDMHVQSINGDFLSAVHDVMHRYSLSGADREDSDFLPQQIATILERGSTIKHLIAGLDDSITTLSQSRDQTRRLHQSSLPGGEEYQRHEKFLRTKAYQNHQASFEQIVTQQTERESRQKTILLQIDESQKRLSEQQTNVDTATKFFCDKIDGNCPYVSAINTVAVKAQTDQYETLAAHHRDLVAQSQVIADRLATIAAQQSTMKALLDDFESSPAYQEVRDDLARRSAERTTDSADSSLDEQIVKKQTERDILVKEREAYVSIFALLSYADYQGREKTMKDYDRSLTEAKNKRDDMSKTMREIHRHRQQMAQMVTDIAIARDRLASLTSQEILVHEQKNLLVVPKVSESEVRDQGVLIDRLMQGLQHVTELVQESRERALQVRGFQETQKMVGELHKLFKEELLLIVLEHFLPTVQDIMNAFLAQIVNYRIQMDVVGSENVELEITVIDELGQRDIASLSGGQNTLIRLVWTLAIAAYQRVPMIFLDETINNLDTDAIGRVAELVRDFARQHTCSLYVVTHSETIQAMDMRQETITL